MRGAITLANTLSPSEPVTIEVPNELAGSGTVGNIAPEGAAGYVLSLDGPDEDSDQSGDLDVHRSLTLRGGPSAPTVVGDGGDFDDRLLEVHGAGTVLVVEDMSFECTKPPAGPWHSVTVGPTAQIVLTRVCIEHFGSLLTGGGALLVREGTAATLDDCRLRFNSGYDGAAIRVIDGTLDVHHCVIEGNEARDAGGGIAADVIDATVEVEIADSTMGCGPNGGRPVGLALRAARALE